MKIEDYGVWLDVMYDVSTSYARMTTMVNKSLKHHIIPYDISAVENLLSSSSDGSMDIAVVVYGIETTNSWLISSEPSNTDYIKYHSFNDIRLFMQANSIQSLKKRYRDEA